MRCGRLRMREDEFNYINVIPLVDIMLVLLTIVLTTATFVVQGEIPLDLPGAESVGKKEMRAVEVSITEEGEIFYGGRRVSVEELREELMEVSRERGVDIRADREAKVEVLVEVMDVLNGLGFRKVSMVVERE